MHNFEPATKRLKPDISDDGKCAQIFVFLFPRPIRNQYFFLDDISLDKILNGPENGAGNEERTKETITTPVISDCESDPEKAPAENAVLEKVTEKLSDVAEQQPEKESEKPENTETAKSPEPVEEGKSE